jgi:flagellar biosynthesis protein FlhF
MNVKRFIGRNSREAMQKVKAAFGDDAVVLSTKPAAEGGIEILAMAGDSVPAMESYEAEPEAPVEAVTLPTKNVAQQAAQQARQAVASLASTVQDDVKQLAMSTLSFQDYVRERMLKRRQAALQARTEPALAASPEEQLTQRFAPATAAKSAERTPTAAPVDLGGDLSALVAAFEQRGHLEPQAEAEPEGWGTPRPLSAAARQAQAQQVQAQARQSAPPQAAIEPIEPPARQRAAAEPVPVAQAKAQPKAASSASNARPAGRAAQVVSLRGDHADLTMDQMTTPRGGFRDHGPVAATLDALRRAQVANTNMLGELRAMRAMMKERFETIAFIEKLGRTPCQAALAQKLLDGGFSAVLIRKMLDAMPPEVLSGALDEVQWATQVLQRNLQTADSEAPIEDQGGIVALIGSTGVGKTTTTAKLAATFAAKHGASKLGLITLDAYRVGAHEQLRAYGRILGVPVHMAHDRAALEDLLELLAGKKLILIDTAGMAQRDSRAKELLDMLAHPAIRKLLVINAAAQGDAIEDVMVSYQASACAGIVLSKLDEAVKLGPALDALIRHKLKVLGVANGQRVPEDWHRLSAQALVHRALRASLNPAYRLDPNEVNLVFATQPVQDPLNPSRSV